MDLKNMVYGLESHSNHVNPVHLAALVYKSNKMKPLRHDGVPRSHDELFTDLLFRLKQQPEEVLTQIAYKYIKQLHDIDSNVSLFVLTATYQLRDDDLISSLRQLAVQMGLARVNFLGSSLVDTGVDAPSHMGLPRIPWDISPVLNEQYFDVQDDVTDLKPTCSAVRDPCGLITPEYAAVLRSEPLSLLRRQLKKLDISAPNIDSASTMTFYSFSTAETLTCMSALVLGLDSLMFPLAEKSDNCFRLLENAEIDGCYGITKTKSIMSPLVHSVNSVLSHIQELRSVDVVPDTTNYVVKYAILETYERVRDGLSSEAAAARSVDKSCRSIIESMRDVLSVIKCCRSLIREPSLPAVDVLENLTYLEAAHYLSVGCLTDIRKRVQSHILREIAVFTYAGYINPSAGVFFEKETNLEIISETVGIEHILGMSMFYSATVFPSSHCSLIVPDAVVLWCLREMLQNDNYIDPIYSSDMLEIHVHNSIQENDAHCEKLCWRCVLSDIESGIEDQCLEDQVTQLRLSRIKVWDRMCSSFIEDLQSIGTLISDVFLLQNFSILQDCGLRVDMIREYLRRSGRGLKARHYECVDLETAPREGEDAYLTLNVPKPLSLVVTSKHVEVFRNVRKMIYRLHLAHSRLSQLDLRNLSFVAGEDRRALEWRTVLIRVLGGAMDHFMMTIASVLDTYRMELGAVRNVNEALNVQRDFAKNVKRRILMVSKGVALTRPLDKMCTYCKQFALYFPDGNARECETRVDLFRETNNLMCQQLLSVTYGDAHALLCKLDIYNGAFVEQLKRS